MHQEARDSVKEEKKPSRSSAALTHDVKTRSIDSDETEKFASHKAKGMRSELDFLPRRKSGFELRATSPIAANGRVCAPFRDFGVALLSAVL